MVNQKNTRNLISFVFGSLKFFFCVIAFPFMVFYDTCNLLFVNFVVSTVFFQYNFAREISSRDGRTFDRGVFLDRHGHKPRFFRSAPTICSHCKFSRVSRTWGPFLERPDNLLARKAVLETMTRLP